MPLEGTARRLCSGLARILDPGRNRTAAGLEALIEFRADLHPFTRTDLAKTLELLAKRACALAANFQ
jgi:hypothetical protein